MHVGFVLLNCDLGAEEYITFGAYDIIAEVHGSDQEDFEKTVSMKIRRLSRIVSTMTLNVVKSG